VHFTHLFSNPMVCGGVGQCDKQSNFTAGIHRVELASRGAHEPVGAFPARSLAAGWRWHWGKVSWSARRATLPGLEITKVSAAVAAHPKANYLQSAPPAFLSSLFTRTALPCPCLRCTALLFLLHLLRPCLRPRACKRVSLLGGAMDLS
jgi:hypothetical protein